MGLFTEEELGGVPRITEYNKKWHTDLNANGAQVEDFITRHLVKEMTYDGGTNELVLLNADSEPIASTTVSVATPDYSHSLVIEKIFIDNIDVTNNKNIQCQLGSKIELGIRYNLVASNPLTGTSNHITGKQNLSIKIGNAGYKKLDQGIVSSDSLQILDVTSLFTNTIVAPISLRVVTHAGVPEDLKIVNTSTENIAVLNPKIRYIGNNYIVNGITSFQVVDGGGITYALRYVLNGGTLTRSNSFNIDLEKPGLNEIEVYAVVANQEDIKSPSIKVQAINIANQDTFGELQYAINEISESVTNWEYSKMYRISLYTKGYSGDLISINTKLTNTADDTDLYFNKVKEIETELINSKNTDQYQYEEDICYFFGMNSLTQDVTAGLVIKINDEDAVAFDDYVQVEISTDAAFTYTEGANFYYDQFDPEGSNIVTKEVLASIESPDGIVQEDSLTVFRVSANEYNTPVLKQDLSKALTNVGLTFELDFKSYNISDPNKPVLKLGKFILYPTELNWQFSSSDDKNVDKTSRSSLFQEDERTHMVIQIAPNFKAPLRETPTQVKALSGKSINLVRIFINGIIDREFKYDTLSDFNLNGFNLEIAPEASDIDIYDLRVYNRALSLEEISNNYISTMSDISEKKFFQKANAIVATDSNNDTYISYTLAKQLYNTIVYIVPKGNQYLHQFSATKSTKLQDCTVFVNYVNNEKLPTQLSEEQIAKSSGRFTGVELKGQGTSAMKYYWYNTSMKGKFTSQGCYDQIEQAYIKPAEGQDLLYNSKYYYMPTDPNTRIKKLVGKTNYASSMQSHKIGATKAFHDLWEACVDKSSFTELDKMGRKAVLEEPFLAFYIESDIESTWVKDTNEDAKDSPMKQITPEYLETIDDSLIRFAGFQTWGSGKGDDATSGYDEDITPGYLMLEGAENDGKLANFLTPWMPECIELSGETYKTLGLIVDDQGNTSYGTFDSLDVDFGLAEDSETELCEAAKKTMERFIEAYNFVYMHTINLEPYTGTTSLNSNENKTLLDITKKYYITNSKYSDPTGFAGSQWDVFRYDQYSAMWVPAGLPVFDAEGKQFIHKTIKSPYGSNVYDYEVFNLKTFYKTNNGTGAESFVNFRQLLIDKFKEGFGNYFHVDDIVFHQAFIKLFAGTDNRAKNTYFKLIDENGKISLLQDDLDTILATDNRGLQKKPYFLLEPSQESNPEYQGMWGGNSAFFEVFDVAYKEEINQMLKSMLTQFEVNQEPSIHNWMQKYFYYVQEYFPATAYNHTARLCYETAQIFFDNQGSVGITWQNNGQDPVSQVHGSCLQSEKEFMKKRLIMFLSQAQVSNIFGKEGMGINIKASEDSGAAGVGTYTIDITPYQYLYLGYNSGSNPNLYSKERQAAEVPFTATITIDSTTPLYSVLGARYIKKFEDFSKIFWKSGTYNLSAKRLVSMSAKAEEGEISNFLPPMINLETPVLTKLDLTGVSSLTTINLDSDHTPKLQEVYLTGTNITNVTLPTGSRLKTVHFPGTLQNLYIFNNPGLVDVQFENYSNLNTIYIDCAKCGKFDVSEFCEQLKDVSLDDVKLLNCNLKLTEKALLNLCIDSCKITGIVEITDELTYRGKQILVEKFGNIDDEKNTLYIKYNLIEPSITVDDTYNIYYDDKTGGTQTKAITPVITGNDIAIIYEDKWVLNTQFILSTTDTSNVVTIDKYSGIVTMNSQPKDGHVKITVFKKSGGNLNPVTSEIKFTWIAAQVGEFIYTDGTFSKSGNLPNKTLMGIIYDKEGTADEGTYYVMGAERTYTVPFVKYLSNSESNLQNFDISGYLKAVLSNLNISPVKLQNSEDKDPVVIDNINHDSNSESNIKNNTAISNTYKNGKSETQSYAKIVTQELLKTLYNKGIKGINQEKQVIEENGSNVEYTEYKISDLITVCNSLKNIKLTDYTISPNFKFINTAILNPYFYSAYMYKPKNLCEEFKDIEWFAPSLGELSRVIYQFVLSLSETISDKTSSNIFNKDIQFTNNGNYSNDFNTGLFTIINNSDVSETIKDLWISVIKGNMITNGKDITIVTTQNDGDCYGYVKDWNSYDYTNKYPIYHAKWCTEVYESGNYGGTNNYQLSPYYESHGPVPFTEIDYINPAL